VTPRPTPRDVFEAATRAARETAQVEQTGTPTATPANLVVATATHEPVIVTATPPPANGGTAAARNAWATAAAFTTGTPTAIPPWMSVATITPQPSSTPLLVPIEQLVLTPTATRTVTPTLQPVPRPLVGKILFLSDRDGEVAAYTMNPDGSGIGKLTSRWPYDAANERDTESPDRAYRALAQKGINNLVQIYFLDRQFNVTRQVTWFGSGVAWSPAWSPVKDEIALVSSESGNDEIWVTSQDGRQTRQLTHNTWEWDHHPTWSPDGKQIAFMSNRSGKRQIWMMDADGRDQRPVTDGAFEAWDPVWVKY
jgi:hypothetical protein